MGTSYVVGDRRDWGKAVFMKMKIVSKGQRMAEADLSTGIEKRRGEEFSENDSFLNGTEIRFRFGRRRPKQKSRFIEHKCGRAKNGFESFKERRKGRRWE